MDMEASSSTSSSVESSIYDVFINHRGPDIKNTLASVIYYHLHDILNLQVFLDKDELQMGDIISSSIRHAISTASVHIAIFSKRYVESAWCLKELCLMLESGAVILPVFYDVNPSALRWIDRGVYAEAFKKYEEQQRFDSQTLKKWKDALHHVSYRVGIEFNSTSNDDYGSLVKRLVNGVLKHVKKEGLEVARHPVGLDEQVEDFENNMLQFEGQTENVKVVGIAGMGGSGKTTLAKELYNRKRSKYANRSCFLFDVRETAKKKGLEFLQGILLNELGFRADKIYSSSQGSEVLGRRLRESSAFIILDDIDHVDQFHGLIVRDVLGSESLVLVTSRSKEVLRQSGISIIYEKKMMDRKSARELFCWHAFLQPQPVDGFGGLVEGFLTACVGLPLSLKVIGGQLYGSRDRNYWECELQKISKILPHDIKIRLKLSYDALDPQEKEIFLDIACLFLGEKERRAVRIWEAMGFQWSVSHSLKSLEDKCLVELDDRNCLEMHDHLRDMGRDIAKSTHPPRLLSRLEQGEIRKSKLRKFLKQPSKQGKLEAGGTRIFDNKTLCIANEKFQSGVWYHRAMQWLGNIFKHRSRRASNIVWYHHMRVSQFLVADDDGRVKGKLAKLFWLRWVYCPYKCIPSIFPMDNLRVLEVEGGRLETLWDFSSSQAPVNLVELYIRHCEGLQEIPRSIGRLVHLELLLLDDIRLGTLPYELCCLRSLKRLELRRCTELRSLPERFGDLTNLQHLDLSECFQLQMLPHSFAQLTQLQYLCFNGCRNLIIPREIFGNISTLEGVDFSGCTNLEVLPSEITGQTYLATLRLEGTNLKELPPSLGNLSCLKELRLNFFPNLRTLPESIGLLNWLEVLEISGSGVEKLPEGVAQLRNLKVLRLHSSPICEVSLKKSSNDMHPSDHNRMFRLRRIELLQTQTTFVSISEDVCPNLETLEVVCCPELMEVEVLPTALLSLQITSCGVLKKVTGLADLAKLRNLDISDCAEIEELPSVAKLRSLTKFIANGCGKLHNIQGMRHLSHLKVLNANGCWKLQSISGLHQLERLDTVHISADNWADMQQLQRLPVTSSNSSITVRAAGEENSEVESILNCLDSPLPVHKFSDSLKLDLSNMKVDSCRALILCFVCKAKTRSFFEVSCGRKYLYQVDVHEGEWINMSSITQDSLLLPTFKPESNTGIRINNYFRELKIKAALVMLAKDGEESEMLEVWNKMLNRVKTL